MHVDPHQPRAVLHVHIEGVAIVGDNHNVSLWLVQSKPELLMLRLLALNISVSIPQTKRNSAVVHVYLPKTLHDGLLLLSINQVLEESLTYFDPPIHCLDYHPHVSKATDLRDPIHRRNGGQVKEPVQHQVVGRDEVIGEEFKSLYRETQQVAVGQFHHKLRAVREDGGVWCWWFRRLKLRLKAGGWQLGASRWQFETLQKQLGTSR